MSVKYLFYALMTVAFIFFDAINIYADTNHCTHNSTVVKSNVNHIKNDDLIKTVYTKFVFATESVNNNPEIYFTNNALKKLQNDYKYDCDKGACYAYYALRTMNQDSNPNSDGVSQIYGIEPIDEGWYIVTYVDMGWIGKTRIRIIDGKIDDYERLEPHTTYMK